MAMITPAQVTESLNVPASTVRRWAAQFKDFLSTQQGKKRMYTVTDVDVFRRIRDLSAQGYSLKRIAEMLPVVEPAPNESTALMTVADFTRSLESAHETIAHLEARIRSLEGLEARIKSLEARDAWYRLPWYQRIGRKPPA